MQSPNKQAPTYSGEPSRARDDNAPRDAASGPEPDPRRRRFLVRACATAMTGGGLCAAYGGFAAIAASYLYPSRPRRTGWMFIKNVADLKAGGSTTFVSPLGERI